MKLEDWRQAGEEFDFGGHPIFYRDEGDGPALLCIHGFPTASWDWHRIWPQLTSRFRVVAADMLGFGFSAKPQLHRYDILEQANLQEALLERLGIESADVLAHDYGVSVAQEMLARRDPAQAENGAKTRLRSVCFLNGGLFPEAHRPRLVQELLHSRLGPLISKLASESAFQRGFSRVFGPKTKPNRQELRDFWTLIEHGEGHQLLHKLLRYIDDRKAHRDRWVDALRHAKIPLKLINGPEDPVSGLHMSEIFRKRIRGAEVVLLQGIGHYPQVEAPEQVVEHYLSFVEAGSTPG